MVMAAGLGTRLRPFTEKTAKPLLPLMGVPMAQFALDLLKRTSVDTIVANVHHFPTASSQAIRFLDAPAPIAISDESALLLGSAGGLAKAAPRFEGKPFFLLNADTICNVHLGDLAKHHLMLKHQFSVTMTLLLFAKAPGNGSYTEILVDRRRSLVTGLGEKRAGRMLYAGVAVIEPAAIANLDPEVPSDFTKRVLEPAIRTGRAGAYVFDNSAEFENNRWFDIGSPELWHQAHLDWIHLYEEDALPAIWVDRILKANRRIGPRLWVSNRAPADVDVSGWKGPAYWAPDANETTPPPRLSPRTILYGKSPFSGATEVTPSGIGYRGLWKTI